ncbi:unnamed protein product [Oikopleura dioica]|uniref:EF-hand domain-containing protein n=1 Tax=Oikopleura dioica TaxID=34765 RepID=E4XJJ8_OIKDI|nr:unnamed protein product [Oikopleura dioica]
MVDEADMDGEVSEAEFLRIMNKTEICLRQVPAPCLHCQF